MCDRISHYKEGTSHAQPYPARSAATAVSVARHVRHRRFARSAAGLFSSMRRSRPHIESEMTAPFRGSDPTAQHAASTPRRAIALLLVVATSCLLASCDAIFQSSLWQIQIATHIGKGVLFLATVLAWPAAAGYISKTFLYDELQWRWGRKFASSLLILLPIPSFQLWWTLGVPPSSGWMFSFVYLLLGLATIVAGVAIFAWCLDHPGRAHRLLSACGYMSFMTVYLAVPPSWAIVSASLARQDLAMKMLEPDEDCSFKAGAPLLAHLSDLHITAGDKCTKDNGMPGNGRLKELLEYVRTFDPAWLVISGDLTDTGNSSDWRELETISSGLTTHIFVAPGNHDVNRYFGKEPEPLDMTEVDAALTAQESLTRLARVALFQSRHGSDTRESSGTLLTEFLSQLPTKENLNTKYEAMVSACRKQCRPNTFEYGAGPGIACSCTCGRAWMVFRLVEASKLGYSFPWVSHDVGRSVSLLSLHSAAKETDTLGQNAVGFVDDSQLNRLKLELKVIPPSTRTVVIALHHPLFVPDPPWPSLHASSLLEPIAAARDIYKSLWFMSIFLENNVVQAKKLFDVLQEFSEGPEKRDVFILYGHRHTRTLSRIKNITLVEAPNVGADDPKDVGVYAVTREGGARPIVHWCALPRAAVLRRPDCQ